MTPEERVSELCLKRLDGTINDDEERELDALLASAPALTALSTRLLAQEAALRGEREELDGLAEKVSARVRAGQLEPRRPWLRPGTVGRLALAAVLLLGIGLGYDLLPRTPPPRAELFVVGQRQLLPGEETGLRVLVRDGSDGAPLAAVPVVFALADADGAEVWRSEARSDPSGIAAATAVLPETLADGDYLLTLRAAAPDGEVGVERRVALRRELRLMLTSDKPLYQPGQEILMRSIALATLDRRPVADSAVVFEVRDAKGNKVFEEHTTSSAFGIASARFRLADQVNQGTYSLRVSLGDTESERTVEVKRYVLPKFRVRLTPERSYAEPGSRLTVDIAADYTFGEAVAGAKIVLEAVEPALEDTPFAVLEGVADEQGRWSVEVPLKASFVGLAARDRDALLSLRATVRDRAGQEVVAYADVTVTSEPLRVELFPESGRLVAGVPNLVHVVAAYADGRPAQATVRISGLAEALTTSDAGIAHCELTPTGDHLELLVTAEDAAGLRFEGLRRLEMASAPLLLHTGRSVLLVGDSLHVEVRAGPGIPRVYLDVVKDGRTQHTASLALEDGRAQAIVDLAPDMAGTLELHAYHIGKDGQLEGDARVVQVMAASGLDVEASFDKDSYRPAETALLRLAVSRDGAPVQAALGLSAVDEAVFALQEMRPGLLEVFFLLREELLRPRYQIHRSASAALREGLRGDPADADQAGALLLASAPARFRPEVGASETFGQRLERSDRDWRRSASRALGVGGVALVTLFCLFALCAFGYAISRLRGPRLPDAARDPERISGLRWPGRALLAGLYLPVVGLFTLAGLRDAVRFDRDLIPIGALAIALLCALGMAAAGLFFRRTRPSGLRTLSGLVNGLPLAYLGALAGLIAVSIAMAARPRWLPENVGVGAVLALFAAYGVLHAGVSGAVVGLLRKDGAGAPWLSLGLRTLAPIAPLAVLVLFSFVMLSAGRGMPGNVTMEAGMDEGVVQSAPRFGDAAPGAAADGEPRVRREFPETLLWIPELITDELGIATVEVPVADAITTYRVGFDALSADGSFGSGQLPLTVFQPFFVDFDLPVALTQNDELAVPVAVYNFLDVPQTVRLELELSAAFALEGSAELVLDLLPGEVRPASFPLTALEPGSHRLLLRAYGNQLSDAVERSVRVEPDGRPVVQTLNGELEEARALTVSIPEEAIDGSLDFLLKIQPSSFSQVLEGLENIFRMPTGCFEQTSSATYPNVLVLDYLERTGQDRPDIALRAREYINVGYQRLLSFECSGGGFEWFGRSPAHTVLTAYGLLEFTDMAKVHPVDPAVIERTRRWMYRQQETDGSWQPPTRTAMISAARTEAATLRTTAYIAWALASSGDGDQRLAAALDYLVAKLGAAPDVYTLALATNALLAADDGRSAALLEQLVAAARSEGEQAWWVGDEGATYSRGPVLEIETTALAVQALVASGQGVELAHAGLRWLLANKDPNGTWFSTQATVHSLRALLAAGGDADTPAEELFVTVAVNGAAAAELEIAPETRDVLRLIDLTPWLREGENRVDLECAGTATLSYQLVATHYEPWEGPPAELPEEPIRIDLTYDSAELPALDLLGCAVEVVCNRPLGADMVIVDLGVPPGFELLPEAFEALVGAGRIEKFSLTGKQAILYLRRLEPGEPLRFRFEMRALYPVKVKTPRSEAWLYYEPELRDGAEPVELRVF